MDISDESPLPTTFEDALAEIRNLRNILFRERTLLAKKVQERELDRRSLRGEIQLLRDDNQKLRKKMDEIAARLAEKLQVDP